jgi:threonine aldolase
VFGSVQPQPLENQTDGTLLLSDIEAAIKPDDIHYARTRLLALENTWSGKLLPMTYVQEATRAGAFARAWRGTSTVRACSTPPWPRRPSPAEGAGPRRGASPQCFDSVSVCLSKGLGAPAGSVLCGSRR